MKRLLFTLIIAGVILVPASATAQIPGEMLVEQGCDVFDLVEDLGSTPTPLGHKGRWLVEDLSDGTQGVLTFETVNLVPPTSEDQIHFSGTSFAAWRLEGTGIQGTNRTTFTATVIDELFNAVGFFEADIFRGNHYKNGGGTGTFAMNLATGAVEYEASRFVLCKAGFGGR